jgi:hypothetical protein
MRSSGSGESSPRGGIVSEESVSDVIAHVSEFYGVAEDGFKPRVDLSST